MKVIRCLLILAVLCGPRTSLFTQEQLDRGSQRRGEFCNKPLVSLEGMRCEGDGAAG